MRRRHRQGRVLIIVQNLPVPLDRRVWQESLALVEAGYQVSVICPRAPGDPDHAVLDGVHVHKYTPPRPSLGALGFAYEFAYCWLQTLRLTLHVLRHEGFDVIQACNPPDTYFALALPFKLVGKRFVFDHHDLCPELFDARFGAGGSHVLRHGLQALESATYRTADHVIVTNASFRAVATGRGSRSPDTVTIVRSGPRAERMRRGRPRPELRSGRDHLVVYLGVMGPQDGVDLLLRGFAHLVHDLGRDDVHLGLLGFGDCHDELVALAAELRIDTQTTFTGRADDQMIQDWFSTADVAVAPDPRNDFNDRCTMNKVIEYMAYELPIVSFDLTETRFSAGDAAVYVGGDDSPALGRAIGDLLDDPDERARMGRVGRARVDRALAWEHQSRHYVAAFDRLLDTPRVEPLRVGARGAA